MYNLFLDDERNPSDVTWIDIGDGPWVIARNEHEFVAIVDELGLPDKFSFDNDLGEEKGEGRWCVNWMIDHILDRKLTYRTFTFTVHSMNTVAKEAIESKLNQFIQHMNQQGE